MEICFERDWNLLLYKEYFKWGFYKMFLNISKK